MARSRESILFIVDEISTWVGKTAGWCIVILTFTPATRCSRATCSCGRPSGRSTPPTCSTARCSCWPAPTRSRATAMCAATSSIAPGRRALRRAWTWRSTSCSSFPGMLAFVYAGYGFAKLSWMMNEHSSASPFGPPVYPFKMLIPIVGVLMVHAGHRRGHPLRPVHPDRRMAAAAARRRGARQGHAREGRARRVRGREGARGDRQRKGSV